MSEHTPRHRTEATRTPPGVPDDDPSWMTMFAELDEDVLEAVLAGRAADVPDPVRDVARVVDALRTRAAAEPVPEMSAALRAQLQRSNVVSLAGRRSRRSLAWAAAAAAVAVVAVGVGAAENRLPAGLQDVVSGAAEAVGIDVPSSDERGAGPMGDQGEGPPATLGDAGHGGASVGAGEGTGQSGTTPATPADPGGAGQPATPATPAQPGGGNGGGGANDGAATPAAPATPGSESGPATPATPATPAKKAEAPSVAESGDRPDSPGQSGSAPGQAGTAGRSAK